jgi:hypothetical protein
MRIKSTLAVLVFALLGVKNPEACPIRAARSARIHWSEAQSVASPNCHWLVQIRPSGDSPADVTVGRLPKGPQRLLFTLNRDGIIHWGPAQSDRLLLEDQQFSNTYRLRLFDLETAESGKATLEINERVREDVEGRLKPTEKINYYFPRFVSWDTGGQLVISVGVVTVFGASGPFTRHCFGYEIKISPLEIRSTISDIQLKKRFGASCQVWP